MVVREEVCAMLHEVREQILIKQNFFYFLKQQPMSQHATNSHIPKSSSKNIPKKPPKTSQKTLQSTPTHSPIQLSTTSVFQMNCRKAKLSTKLPLRCSAVPWREPSLFLRLLQRCLMLSALWLPCWMVVLW